MYTYAFLLPPSTPLELPQGVSHPLQLLCSSYLCALVEPELDWDNLQQNDAQLMQAVLIHDQVLQAVFQQTDLLPLRFGTRFASADLLLEHLEHQYGSYVQKLRELANKAEYLLKLSPLVTSEPDISTEVTGKAYFLAKKQRYQTQVDQQQQQRAELEALLEAIAPSFPYVFSDNQDSIKRIYLLGDRHQLHSSHPSILAWQAICPHWNISLEEFLPPYHFVSSASSTLNSSGD